MTITSDAVGPGDSGAAAGSLADGSSAAQPDVPTPAAELAGRIAGLRRRTAGRELDRGLLLVGGILLPLGVLLVVLGWLGAAHTVLLFEQIPYLVSGGLLGLALVVVGGFVYFAYWQTLLVRDGRDQHRELLASLGRIETLLTTQVGESRITARSGNTIGTPAPLSEPASLVVTPTGTMLHRPDCPVVAGRAGVREVPPGTHGFEACRICHPLD